jgi:exodeoxyribonuclease VII large subunit
MADLFSDSGDSARRAEPQRQVWKISELTRRIKGTLEGAFGSVWVEGEISNFRKPASGHAYFTLKDETSQLRAVMFRGALAGVTIPLRDGLLVRGFGQITVYEAAGDYQILLKRIEPAGEGELMLRLEALKKKLAAEGLFASERKRPLPVLPQHVGIVTSPTGAAIRDILQVLDRRFANLHVVLAPVRVQGAGAAGEIAAAMDLLNARGEFDVLIVGRGGGSLEDLWCFNEEAVVRAIVRSKIPVISAVGHEIDWTLSDFAADVRAPTPSAAAEMVVRGKDELERRVVDLRRRLALGARSAVLGWRNRLDRAARTPALLQPLQEVQRLQQGVDFLAVRLQNALAGLPQLVRQQTAAAARRMELAVRMRLDGNRRVLKQAEAQLRMLNPKGVLARGYSLTRLRGGRILRSAAGVAPGTELETEFADGAVLSTVDSAGGEPHGSGKIGKAPELREGAGAAGADRGGDGKRRPRPGKNGGRLRGGPEAGQALLF